MTPDFDQILDRRQSDSLKWQACRGSDVLPMWAADMDFASPPCILQALRQRVDQEAFGYPVATAEVTQAVVDWAASHYAWYSKAYLAVPLPMFSVSRVEATYLAWRNTRALGARNAASFFAAAGVRRPDGAAFHGRGFMRLNFGCPQATLHEARERIQRAVTQLGP